MPEPSTRECDLIRWIRGQARTDGLVLVGIGDDAALVRTRDASTLITTDLVIEGVHFDRAVATPADAGWKALARNISDIAAMGGESTAAVVAAALPRGFARSDAEALVQGLLECANAFGIRLVGGDLAATPGPLVLAVTLLGDLRGRAPILRSGARPGDAILVTGTLGGSRLGKHLRFTPRQAAGLILASSYRPHAMIDISDGLARDLHHLLDESGVGATLWADRIPVSQDALRLAALYGRSPLDHALGDGEDYELLFAADPGTAERLLADQPLGVPVTQIGVITEAGAVLALPDGTERPLEPTGWEHIT
ncbi:MAG TPA: thiamine-phosphate kinase [Planctomycetota bacterium]|nr:thiamine-phosphate kinase [Planctomycetota bacterium]HRR80286.1 thiamine-phosphate kinase [Planctomycetota bacterium]HRT95928.1 thiamine-phosphate kinase [Planctomycetota bacterium]